ncbi:hypothetical protein TURU_082087 [Turdus rufiventris]|nr:hypothetical protein TURU_082087 [Turdus rufiventris]
MSGPDVLVSMVATMLEEALYSRKGTISVIQINSHDPIKGFYQIGNDKADAAAKGVNRQLHGWTSAEGGMLPDQREGWTLSRGSVLYRQEEEVYCLFEEPDRLHRQEVIMGITIAMLLGLGATSAATDVSALATQHQGLSQLQMTIDEDL